MNIKLKPIQKKLEDKRAKGISFKYFYEELNMTQHQFYRLFQTGEIDPKKYKKEVNKLIKMLDLQKGAVWFPEELKEFDIYDLNVFIKNVMQKMLKQSKDKDPQLHKQYTRAIKYLED